MKYAALFFAALVGSTGAASQVDASPRVVDQAHSPKQKPSTAAALIASPSMTAFGIRLGSTFTIPACPTKDDGIGGPRIDYEAMAKLDETCFEPPASGSYAPPYTGTLSIRFSSRESPSYLYTPEGSDADFFVSLIDGKVESITAHTAGVQVQGDVLTRLTAKYGKPLTLTTDHGTTMGGTPFDSVTAAWRFTDIDVTFSGTNRAINSGFIMISTIKGQKDMERKVLEQSAKGTQIQRPFA